MLHLKIFEKEIELFNQANKGVIEATVIDPEKEDRTPILIKSSLIRKIKKLYSKHGYALPETIEAYADIIDDLVLKQLEE